MSLLVLGCSSTENPSDDGGGNGGGIPAQATYIVTFEPSFTSDTHPTDYPGNAGFSKMVIVAHGTGTSLFSIGSLASAGFKDYVENGNTSMLEAELSSTELNPTTIKIGNDISADGSDSATIVITPSTTRISVAIKISPSPDWFLGMNAQNFLNPDNTLVESIGFRLYPLDGGTDSGTTYLSPDEPEPGPIQVILGLPFVDPMTNEIASLGMLNFQKID